MIYRIAGGWTDIITLAASYNHLVGLRTDGALLAAGANDDGQCNVDPLFIPPFL